MITVEMNEKYASALKSINYKMEEALDEFLILKFSASIAEYTDECKFFEAKYRVDFKSFEDRIQNRVDEEDFEEYDDYMAWKFAEEGRQYYQEQLNEIVK